MKNEINKIIEKAKKTNILACSAKINEQRKQIEKYKKEKERRRKKLEEKIFRELKKMEWKKNENRYNWKKQFDRIV